MKSQPNSGRLNTRGRTNSRKHTATNSNKRVQALSPQKLFNTLEHVNDGLVVLDKDWYYVYVNQKAAKMLQREKPSDLIGKHIWTEYPEGVGRPFQLAYEKAMREQIPIVFEDHYEPWDLWFENRIYPSPETLTILFTEVTERKRSERLLAERQHILHKILDTEPGTVYLYDLEQRRNIYINRHWLSAFGYSPEETQSMGEELIALLIHPEDLPLIAEHHKNWRRAEEGEIRTVQYRMRAKEGAWRWLYSRETPFLKDEYGTVRQILGIAHDVTDQIQMQEAVLKEKNFSEAMLNSLPGVFYFYDRAGTFLRWNRNFEVLTGYSAEEIKQMHPLDFFQGQEKDYIAERIEQVFARGESDAEANFTTKHGELLPYYYTGKRIEIEGQPYLIGMGIDITARKRAEQENRILLRELKERVKELTTLHTAARLQQEGADVPSVIRELASLLLQAFQHPETMAAHIRLGQLEATTPGFTSSDSSLRADFTTADGQTGFIEVSHVQDCPPEVRTSFLAEERALIHTLADMLRAFYDRKQAEEALRLSESRYRAVVEHQTEFIVRWKPEGVRTFVNEAYCQYFGLTPEEALSADFMQLVAGEDQTAVRDKISRLLSGAARFETDVHQVIKPDGSIGWQEWVDQAIYDETGKIVEIQSVGRDVTERKRTEDALATSEAEMRALFASMDDVVLVIDWAGVYRKIAPTNPKLLYKPRAELLGKNLRDIFPVDRAESFIATVRQVIETQTTAHIEYPLTIDGQVFWFDTTISPMDTDKTLWMARDITDRKQAEERLQRLNEELEQRVAQRTEELAAAMIRAQESDRLKSAFLASMSHELRTPLNSIIGFTGVILQGLAGPLNEEQAKQLNMTRDSARHLLALINDVLDISKIEAGQLEIFKHQFDMRETLAKALQVVQPLLNKKKQLQMRVWIGQNVGSVYQDRRRVEQVLINLVNNAIKFTEQGEVRIECQVRDGWMEICVRDSGIGIKPEDMHRLFKPFQQIDTGPARGHEGTGLGLSICQRLVHAMGGTIDVESQWGIGSTFRFTLPV